MGRCCPNDNIGSNCLLGTSLWDNANNRLNIQHQKSTDFKSRMTAIGGCPQNKSKCAGKRHVRVASYGQAVQSLTMTDTMDLNGGCSWVLEAQCGGAPAWEIDPSSTVNDNDVYFHFMEYTGSTVQPNSFYAQYPAPDTEVNEHGMKYGFVPGQLYPADWDISPPGITGQNIVEVPMSLVAEEITNKQK